MSAHAEKKIAFKIASSRKIFFFQQHMQTYFWFARNGPYVRCACNPVRYIAAAVRTLQQSLCLRLRADWVRISSLSVEKIFQGYRSKAIY